MSTGGGFVEAAKPIVGILTSRVELRDEILQALGEYFGPADIVGEWQRFDHTGYYEGEMGPGLFRSFVSFERLVSPETAMQFKGWTAAIEDRYRRGTKRTVNLDPGALDANKVLLITGKHGGHRIALGPRVFADLLLWYNKGWTALPWAFPDFRDGRLFPLFTRMRARFKEQARTP